MQAIDATARQPRHDWRRKVGVKAKSRLTLESESGCKRGLSSWRGEQDRGKAAKLPTIAFSLSLSYASVTGKDPVIFFSRTKNEQQNLAASIDNACV